jgi:signal transduction histidine kinase/AmiR/NasT family two-component response regulator
MIHTPQSRPPDALTESTLLDAASVGLGVIAATLAGIAIAAKASLLTAAAGMSLGCFVGSLLARVNPEYERQSIWLQVTGMALLGLSAATFGGGLASPHALWLVFLPPITTLLLGRREGLAMMVLTLFAVVLLAWFGTRGSLPIPVQLGSRGHAFGAITVSVAAMTLFGATQMALSTVARRRRETRPPDDLPATNDAVLRAVSHELRTPMHGMLSTLEQLRQMRLDPDAREWIEMLHDSAAGLERLVEDLLDAAATGDDAAPGDDNAFDLHQLVQEVAAVFRPRAVQQGLSLDVRLDAGPGRWVRGDPVAVRKILVHLLANAVKFTQEGDIVLSVHVASTHSVFEIQDTGIGIAPDQLERIFLPFVQVDDRRRRRFGGSGLGLAVARSLARRVGGDLTVESQVGKGSVFRVDLPLEDATDTLVNRVQARRAERARRTLKVLVAEDDRINQMVIRAMLERVGHRVIIAENGREALRMAGQERFDVVLMDVMMPVLDGLETTRRLRASPNNGHLPILALTADPGDDNRRACTAAGMDAFIAKPVRLPQLEAELQRFAWGRTHQAAPMRAQA